MDLSDGESLPTRGTFVLCVYGTADTRVAEDVTARCGSEMRSFGSNLYHGEGGGGTHY